MLVLQNLVENSYWWSKEENRKRAKGTKNSENRKDAKGTKNSEDMQRVKKLGKQKRGYIEHKEDWGIDSKGSIYAY